MHLTFDAENDVAYLYVLTPDDPARRPGDAVRQVVAEDDSGGEAVLDFDARGRLLGIELLSAERQLHPSLRPPEQAGGSALPTGPTSRGAP